MNFKLKNINIVLLLITLGCNNHSTEDQTFRTLENILKSQREAYLNEYTELSVNCDGVKESLLAMNNESEEELFRLYRPDCLLKDENGEFSINDYNSSVQFNHEKLEIASNVGVIELNPFQWNNLNIVIEGSVQNMDKLITWGKKWIDADDNKEINPQTGFQEVIHSISIENEKDRQAIFIDLGTSTIDAFVELLEVLKQSGVQRIVIK